MFKNSDELKEFILWAKREKIQQFVVGDTQIVFSTLALVDEPVPNLHMGQLAVPVGTEEKDTTKTWADEKPEDPENEDELLFWSSQT